MGLLYSKQPTQRQLAVASSMQKLISSAVIKNEIYHPDLEDVIIVFPFAKITPDLKNLIIYVDCIDKSKLPIVLEVLKSLSNNFKKLIANKLNLKYVPEIRFIEDEITQKETKILKIMDELA